MQAYTQRGVGRERAGGRVVGGGHLDAVHVQARSVGQARADVHARRGVVGGGCSTGGALHGAHVVVVAGGCRRGARGRGVHGHAQRGTRGTFVAGGIGQRVRDGMRAISQGRGGRERAGDRVVGGGHLDAVHVQGRRVGQVLADVDARRGVVGGGCGAGGALHGADVVVVAGGRGRGARGRGVHGHAQRGTRGTFVAGGIGQRVRDGMRAISQGRGGRERAGGRVVGGRHLDAVHVQGRRVGQALADVDARRGVVGGGCGAGGALHGAHVVRVVRRCGRGGRGGQIRRTHLSRGTDVAGRIGRCHGQLLAVGQCRAQRNAVVAVRANHGAHV